MVAEGLAVLPDSLQDSEDVDEDVQLWFQFQDEARAKALGIWKHGDGVVADLLQDDY